MQETLLLLAMGGVNGLIHALDADHVVAVTTLATRGRLNRARLLATSLHWALGHGLSLSLICSAVLLFGLTLPPWFAGTMELAVGTILVLVGLTVLYRCFRSGFRYSVHRHGGVPGHFHLHGDNHSGDGLCSRQTREDIGRDHRPVLIGLVHGAAGSAPLLAVLPLMVQQRFGLALTFILVFSSSVALMMCICGGLLGGIVVRLQARFVNIAPGMQVFLGLLSAALGCFWIFS